MNVFPISKPLSSQANPTSEPPNSGLFASMNLRKTSLGLAPASPLLQGYIFTPLTETLAANQTLGSKLTILNCKGICA